jgi:hypothetical protein
LKTAVLPRTLNYLGLAAGAAGLITVIPALEAVGAVFGIEELTRQATANVTSVGWNQPL